MCRRRDVTLRWPLQKWWQRSYRWSLPVCEWQQGILLVRRRPSIAEEKDYEQRGEHETSKHCESKNLH